MAGLNVLLIAGTHGNEVNAPWLLDQWKGQPSLINTHALNVFSIIGNPLARTKSKRYIDYDLNRSFTKDILYNSTIDKYEFNRARNLINEYGSRGKYQSQIVIDCHSTTASMGSSLVIYGRRTVDLAIASLIQSRIGLPVYLYEGDDSQSGFLVQSWPCGLVLEIGPVAQSLLDSRIVNQTLICLNVIFEELSKVKLGVANFPEKLIVHRHLKSIDYPRDFHGKQSAVVHPRVQGNDWLTLYKGSPLFQYADGKCLHLDDNEIPEKVTPIFINEAAYKEKGIAMILTSREDILVQDSWNMDLNNLLNP